MSFWSFVAICVVCGCLLEAYRIYAKSAKSARSKTAGGGEAELEARIAALESGDDLEERVRTLEAIVTDPKFHLDQEISKLKS